MPILPIRQLSSEIIGQIAAGEVVERPSAAIKELVENSMDAGATAITVEIRDGGLSMFRVVDNGSGIRPEDIRLAFARHATSKIRKADDLIGVQTLGFRGEALASIAAVSRVTCTTRIRDAEHGISVQNNGGVLSALKEAACPEGTSFVVKDLFYNTPVRKKFLKKPSVETSYVSDLMQRLLLSNPHISFRYIADGKTLFFSAGDGKLESAVMSVYGLNTLEKLHRVQGHQGGVVLDGFIGVGDLARGTRSHQTFVLNGRIIKSNLLTSVLEDACRQRVMIGRFPLCILHLTMPFEATDVNVHPNKWEVRFQNEPELRQALDHLVRSALQETSPLASAGSLFDKDVSAPISHVKSVWSPSSQPPFKNNKTEFFSERTISTYDGAPVDCNNTNVCNLATTISPNPSFSAAAPSSSPFDKSQSGIFAYSPGNALLRPSVSNEGLTANSFSAAIHKSPPSSLSTIIKATDPVPPPSSLPNENNGPLPTTPTPNVAEQQTLSGLESKLNELRIQYLGVAFHTYVIFECDKRLFFCDQHAAHERILYERMLKAYAGDTASQLLLTPVVLHLTPKEYGIYLENRNALLSAGFDASDFGDSTVQLRSVPMVLGATKSAVCFRDALDSLEKDGRISPQQRTDRIIQLACKHAVKGGENLPVDALKDLIRSMVTDNITPTCPHGRPLVIEVSQHDLEKHFGRIQK